jgi:hypothetical protein
LSQFVVGDLRQARRDTRGSGRVGRRNRLAQGVAQRRLTQCDALDGAPTEEAVDTLADDVGEVLNLNRRRALDA